MSNLAVSLGHVLSSFNANDASDEPSAMIIPPAIPGSLGDAAMISASIKYLRDTGSQYVDLLYGNHWELDETVDKRIAAERFFYKQSKLQQMLLVARLPAYSSVYFIGADVIDGAYNPSSVCARLSLLAEAAKRGKRATLLGASYNTHPEVRTQAALRNLPESVTICARDPVSKMRMEYALERPIRQVADLAFLLPPKSEHPVAARTINWINERRGAGDIVIGLNANYLHAEKDPGIIPALKRFVAVLMKQSVSIVLVPHDTRSKLPDEKLLELAIADLPASERERVYSLPPLSPGVVRAVMPSLDFLATGRMHTAILSLSATTPTFCFAYQDKFEGLLQLVNLVDVDLLSSPQELVNQPEEVAEKFLRLVPQQQVLRKRIAAALPSVMALAKKNFD